MRTFRRVQGGMVAINPANVTHIDASRDGSSAHIYLVGQTHSITVDSDFDTTVRTLS